MFLDKIPVVLSARVSSSRLPRKCLLPLGRCKTVIEFLTDRIQAFDYQPIVFTSDEFSDDAIEDECKRLGVPVFRGDLNNKLLRWRDGLSTFRLDWGHFADMDDPFLDGSQISESVEYFHSERLDLLKTSRLSDAGFASVGLTINREYLDQLIDRAEKLKHKDFDVIPWNHLIGDSDRVSTFRDVKYATREDFRLTLDYPEDYKLLNFLANHFTPGVERRDLEIYLEKNPDLVASNINRTKDFLQNKSKMIARFELQQDFVDGKSDARREV